MSRHPSDSSEQTATEEDIIQELSKQIGAHLEKRKLKLKTCTMEIDGYSQNPPVTCEASAHIGEAKSGQINKVMKDAFKLLSVDRALRKKHRKVLAFIDEKARKPFIGDKWQAQCLKRVDFETYIVSLPKKRLEAIERAQKRQGGQ